MIRIPAIAFVAFVALVAIACGSAHPEPAASATSSTSATNAPDAPPPADLVWCNVAPGTCVEASGDAATRLTAKCKDGGGVHKGACSRDQLAGTCTIPAKNTAIYTYSDPKPDATRGLIHGASMACENANGAFTPAPLPASPTSCVIADKGWSICTEANIVPANDHETGEFTDRCTKNGGKPAATLCPEKGLTASCTFTDATGIASAMRVYVDNPEDEGPIHASMKKRCAARDGTFTTK